jgi:sugar/nucleoside kinase (ribokinase family)
VADIPPGILGPVLDRADWWSCNQREASLLTGTDQPAEAARQLRARLPRASIMVRTGAAGCTLATGDDPLTEIPAPHVAAVDTTGAGDAHAGVFLAAMACRLSRRRPGPTPPPRCPPPAPDPPPPRPATNSTASWPAPAPPDRPGRP